MSGLEACGVFNLSFGCRRQSSGSGDVGEDFSVLENLNLIPFGIMQSHRLRRRRGKNTQKEKFLTETFMVELSIH